MKHFFERKRKKKLPLNHEVVMRLQAGGGVSDANETPAMASLRKKCRRYDRTHDNADTFCHPLGVCDSTIQISRGFVLWTSPLPVICRTFSAQMSIEMLFLLSS